MKMLKKVVVVDAYKIRRATKEMTDSDFKEMLWLIKKLQTNIRQVTISNAPHHSEYSFNPASQYGLTMQVQPPTTSICETPMQTLNDVVYVELTRKEDTVELIVEYSDGMPERVEYTYTGIGCTLLNLIRYSVDVSKVLRKLA
jgi:hypothetical protein